LFEALDESDQVGVITVSRHEYVNVIRHHDERQQFKASAFGSSANLAADSPSQCSDQEGPPAGGNGRHVIGTTPDVLEPAHPAPTIELKLSRMMQQSHISSTVRS
jgi:hypothetical protein